VGDPTGGAEDVVHRVHDLARRVAAVQVIPGQLDETARAEEGAPALAAEETVDDPPDEVSDAQNRGRHRSEVLHASGGVGMEGRLLI
jgi:hypothetical protein